MEPIDSSLVESPSVSPLYIDSVKMRVEAVREAVKRSRLIFAIGTTLSLTVVIGLYIAYVSWNRGFVLEPPMPGDPKTRLALETLIAEWVRSQWISIAPLGLRVSIADAALLGSVALFVISLWFFFAVRRENHVICMLLADTDREDLPTREYIYHGIVSHLVFLDTTGSDDPIDSLEPSPPRRHAVPFISFVPV